MITSQVMVWDVRKASTGAVRVVVFGAPPSGTAALLAALPLPRGVTAVELKVGDCAWLFTALCTLVGMVCNG